MSFQKHLFMKEKLHLITYGDKKYTKSKRRIYNEAFNTNWFYSIKCYAPRPGRREIRFEY